MLGLTGALPFVTLKRPEPLQITQNRLIPH